jgi:hypothetical protein
MYIAIIIGLQLASGVLVLNFGIWGMVAIQKEIFRFLGNSWHSLLEIAGNKQVST